MEISSGASPSSQLGQQLPNLYKNLRASNKQGVYTPRTSLEFFSQQLAVLGGFSPFSCFKRSQQRELVMAAWAVGSALRTIIAIVMWRVPTYKDKSGFLHF